MIARYRFALTLALAFASLLAVASGLLLLVALDLEPAQRAMFAEIFMQRKGLLVTLGLALLCALGFGLNAFFAAYVEPVARLGEAAVLLTANPEHRVTPQGARETRVLADKINTLAAAYQGLHDDIRIKIDQANSALAEERNRLAALMSELALGVLVCNIEGRILLYNTRAKQLLDARRGPGLASSSAVIGLGRSIFGAIERGLIAHALDQIEHQFRERRADRAEPVAVFVATLAAGQTVRANMAPVLDRLNAVDGFVLTLEDITRGIELDSRRDALLQSLTQDARASLANIRAAVEALQTIPQIPDARRQQFTGIIDEESQRLSRQIELAVRQHGADPAGRWHMEEMRAGDLLGLLQRRISIASLRTDVSGMVDTGLWLKVDSYALTQAMAYLARRLASEHGVGELSLSMRHSGRHADLDLAWSGQPLAVETLQSWENAPIQLSAAGDAVTLNAVVARHGGETVYHFDAARRASRYRLLLPVTEREEVFEPARRYEERPEFYDFDLFHQPGQKPELDQRLLSQLSYTVFDTETTGLDPAAGDEIISIGALRIVNGRLLQGESFDQLIKPQRPLSAESIGIHGITDRMLAGQPPVDKVLPQFHRFAEDTVLVAHNAAFDMRFLQLLEADTGATFTQPVLDTLLLSQVIHPHQPQHTLEAIATGLGVAIVGRHSALGDAIVTGEVFLKMIPLLAEKGILTLQDAREAARQTAYARIRY
ncbi:MAG: dnaQ [Herminiimonas sp.]|nr:dnaQ [Herminiimonas sp.]